MIHLKWNSSLLSGSIANTTAQVELQEKPSPGFPFEDLEYDQERGRYFVDKREMTSFEKSACRAFVGGYFSKTSSPYDNSAMQVKKGSRVRDFLRFSDWYVMRAFETGKPIPEKLSKRRLAARAFLDTQTTPRFAREYQKLVISDLTDDEFIEALSSLDVSELRNPNL